MNKFIFSIILFFCIGKVFPQGESLKRAERLLDKYENQISDLQKENDRLQRVIDALLEKDKLRESELTETLKKYFLTSQKLEEANDRISDLEDELNESFEKYSELIDEDKKLKKKVNATKAKLVGLTTLGNSYSNSAEQYEDRLNVIFIQINKVYIINNAREQAKNQFPDIDTPWEVEQIKKEKRKLNYLSLGTGIGSNYSGLIGLGLQSRFGKRVGVGFHISGGLIPNESVNAGAGFKFFYYRGGFVDFSYVKNIVPLFDSYYNETIVASTGWDIFFGRHFGLRAAVGGAFVDDDGGEVLPVFDFGVNYKF